MGNNTYDTLKMLYLQIKVFRNKFGIRRKELVLISVKRIIINLFVVQLSEIQFQVGLQSEESQEQDTQTGHVHIGKYM